MTVVELQNHIRDQFMEQDRARGAQGTFLCLIEEIGELSTAIVNGDQGNAEEELADSLMWLLAVANLLSIDMQSAIDQCLSNPRKFTRRPLRNSTGKEYQK